MIIRRVFSLVFMATIFLLQNNAKAQFEQKFTFQAAGGYVHAISPESFTRIFMDGFSIDAGAQYNFSRSLSFVVLAKYSKYFAGDDFVIQDANYNLVGISLCPKYRFFPRSNVNPYIYGGASINYYSFSYSIENTQTDTPWEAQLGFNTGLGFDFRINDNLAFFTQGGVGGVNHPNDMIINLYVQAGVNISMVKARTL